MPSIGTHKSHVGDDTSDYGSDFDDRDLSDLLSTAESQPLDDIVLTSIEQDPVTEHAIIHLRTPGRSLHESGGRESEVDIPVTYTTSVQSHASEEQRSVSPCETTKAEPSPPVDETRSPLERFRTRPKKPLSVTDIVSPAWCEQQYLFSLSKHGRVRRTPAMKQGSAVHKALEQQVHTTVRIEVKSREDVFGLKLWNVIQGLRTLRQTGLTRELEVWGLLHGQVVNGIIDVITSTTPDPDYEEKLLQRQENRQGSKRATAKREANQTTLTGFVTSQSGSQLRAQESGSAYYLMDVKTRQSRTVPADDSRLRPMQMQLMLYRRLLSSLGNGEVDSSAIFERYSLNDETVFSDLFITEIAKLDLDARDSQQDSVSELLEHNTLRALWVHMIDEFNKTFTGLETALSSMLTAEFRAGSDGALLGRRSFEYQPALLEAYVQDELSWWKGERDTRGVEIEEAFKCRICEFAAECPWRKNKVEQAVQQTRQRKAAQARSTSNG